MTEKTVDMLTIKNRMTLPVTLGTFMLALLTHMLFRWVGVFQSQHGVDLATYSMKLNSVLVAPVVLLVVGAIAYAMDKQRLVPVANALSMTLSSVAMIFVAGGMVEFFFSIFMVIALMAFYESTALIWLMTGVFALQYATAFFFFPELVFGSEGYGVKLLLVHLVFLLLTAGTTVWQISKKKVTVALLEADKLQKQQLLEQTLNQLTVSSGQLVRYVEHLNDNADRTLVENRSIMESMQSMAAATEEQAQNSNDSARAMEEMTIGVQRVAESSGMVTEASMGMVREAEKGSATIHHAVDQLDSLQDTTRQVAQALERLEQQSMQIGEIATIISGIASQTNLLALNAAIEAARAGEHGTGFAVVATEVRKLAEQSEASAGQIGELIEEVQRATSSVVEIMKTGTSEVEAGHQAVGEAGEVFRLIVEEARGVCDQIQEISASAQQMSAGTEEVSASLNEMARLSGNNAQGARQVLASSQHQLQAMESVSEATEGLRQLARELEKICVGLNAGDSKRT
ncbi:methyl-accepting chemotaxis protein [Paenibacillus sp. UNCCL117]|uniref:methyl-accepting chemotaxis protein n=1 Tax=unclassified Paenibacillus TaxID=185978 RepID=UPI00087E5D1D|nr:methyl-accepting chemotaxis protein [Paenibacillus sp. cl123]SFW69111.1 methyl-accepting chemotaxis protein [Paenibacillus sp. UNCCL117]